MGSSLPIEDWFIFRQDAALAYLAKVLREIHWKASRDPFLDRLGLSTKGNLVRVLEEPDPKHICDCGCRNFFPHCKYRGKSPVRCAFRFELDRGRAGMGHEYVMEILSSKTLFWRMDQWEQKKELKILNDLLPEDLLKSIRESIIIEIMNS